MKCLLNNMFVLSRLFWIHPVDRYPLSIVHPTKMLAADDDNIMKIKDGCYYLYIFHLIIISKYIQAARLHPFSLIMDRNRNFLVFLTCDVNLKNSRSWMTWDNHLMWNIVESDTLKLRYQSESEIWYLVNIGMTIHIGNVSYQKINKITCLVGNMQCALYSHCKYWEWYSALYS